MDAQAADSPVTPAPGADVSGASQVVNAGDFVRPADESEAPPCGRTRRSRSSVQSVKRKKRTRKCQSQCTSEGHGCQHLPGYWDGRCLVDELQQLEASGICLLYLESRFPFVCACGMGLCYWLAHLCPDFSGAVLSQWQSQMIRYLVEDAKPNKKGWSIFLKGSMDVGITNPKSSSAPQSPSAQFWDDVRMCGLCCFCQLADCCCLKFKSCVFSGSSFATTAAVAGRRAFNRDFRTYYFVWSGCRFCPFPR